MQLTQRGRRIRLAVVTAGALAVVAVAGTLAVRALGGPVVVSERCTAVVDGQEHSLAPDQSANAALITAIAVQRGLPARAATIGIATAIQESKLRNIDYGDRDSLGIFQQRPSQGWGTPEQVTDPVYATNAFYDVLVEIEGYEGLAITDAAQQVQRSGFPEAYADHEPEGRVFASALTGFSAAALTCRLREPADLAVEEAGASGITPRTQAVLDAAQVAFGDLDAAPGATGTSLAVTTGEGDAGLRRAWALAHWAVASAQSLDVVRVTVDGRQWERAEPGAGWAETDDAPAGQVVVHVAPGS